MAEYYSPKSDPIFEISNAVLAHPRFDIAALYYFENIMKWRREIGFVDKFISGYSRYVIIYYVCYLHFINQSNLPENGATFGRIWDLVEKRSECGSRALRTVLGIASLVGYFKKTAGLVDKRAVAYVPTDLLLKNSREHLAQTLKCLDILFDVEIYEKQVVADTDYIATTMRLIGPPVVNEEIKFIEINPLLANVARTSGGLATLFAIAEAQLKHLPLAHPKVIAKTGKFSESQIRANIHHLKSIGSLQFIADTNMIAESDCVKFNKTILARELALHIKYTLGLEDRFLVSKKS